MVEALYHSDSLQEDGHNLLIGDLTALNRRFVSPESQADLRSLLNIDLNSYVFEFFDVKKERLQGLIQDRKKLEILLQHTGLTPYNLRYHLARMGNFIVEFPNELIVDFSRINDTDVVIQWDSRFTNHQYLKCLFFCNDEINDEFSISDLMTSNMIEFPERRYLQLVRLIDQTTNLQLLLTSNCKGFSMQFSVARNLEGKRTFRGLIPDMDIFREPGHFLERSGFDEIKHQISTDRFRREISQNTKSLFFKQYIGFQGSAWEA